MSDENMFYEKVSFRALSGTKSSVERLCKKHSHRWDNPSMFYRAAVAKYLRELHAEGVWLYEER